MKILYIGRHRQVRSNDDEGAIAHALTELGHQVVCAEEARITGLGHLPKSDLILFNKWNSIRRVRRDCPAVFWYFDLVLHPDPTLRSRCETRLRWMNETVPHVDLGFLTDGDFVDADHTGKLVWLPQGADERVAGKGTRHGDRSKPLLYTGIVKNGGEDRISWYKELVDRYGPQLTHYSNGIYGREMADKIAEHHIVLAPDSPVTSCYWSNRVWNALGFGAFMIHPYCSRLAGMYQDCKEIIFYKSRQEMYELIDLYLPDVDGRHEIASAGLARTLAEHTYRHRAKQLLDTVRMRLGVR